MSATSVKICGLSTPATLDAAVDAGASHVGLVWHPASSRHVDLDTAARLRRRVPAAVKVVLLMVDQTPQETIRAIEAVQPDVVQFHGDEAPKWLALVKEHTKLEVWKAIGVSQRSSIEHARTYVGAADRILFDAPAHALPGGNGLAADWRLLEGLKFPLPWGLAGGLDPDNVAGAIRQTGAPLVDVSSGVESAPGVKDVDKIRAFCKAAHAT